MKKLNLETMENLTGGILPPGPGEAERCRTEQFLAYIMASGGNPLFLTPNDFECQF